MTSKREPARTQQPGPGERQAAGAAGRAQPRRLNVLVGVLAALVVVGVVVAAALTGGGDSTTDAGADPGAQPVGTVTEDGSATGAAEPSAAAAPVDTTCPPGPTPVAEPAQVAQVPPAASGTWTVRLAMTCGDVVMELDADAAPVGVGSFLFLADSGFYDQTPCHRLTVQGIFVLQCGDPTGTGTGGPGYTYGPVENAPADDVYPAGTVAMARVGGDGESMGSQFFLVYEDSTIPSDAAGGYTVLGRITEGLENVRLVAEGGLAGDGIAPARSTGIVSVTAEESA